MSRFGIDDPRSLSWPSVEDAQSECDECGRACAPSGLLPRVIDGIRYLHCQPCAYEGLCPEPDEAEQRDALEYDEAA